MALALLAVTGRGTANAEDGCNNGFSSSSFYLAGGKSRINYNDAWRFRAERTSNTGSFTVKAHDTAGVQIYSNGTSTRNFWIGLRVVNFSWLAGSETVYNNVSYGSTFNYERSCTKV